jgi:hypothetical protein
VVFIDWDLATPGARIHDVAHICWAYLALGPEVADVTEAARLVRRIADAYGLADRSPLVSTILWWQDRCWRGIVAGAGTGDPACLRLRAAGVVEEVQAAYRWTVDVRPVLERALA